VPRRRDFSGRVVVITGAGGGLGRAFSRRFARAGARLALLDLAGDTVEDLARELAAQGVECIALACDVSDQENCSHAIETVIQRLGGIDVLINNAGVTHRSAFADTDLAVFRKVMGVNFFGPLHCTKAALRSVLDRRGLIIAISSIAGFAPLYGRTGYSASKHACQGLFSSLRSELAGSGVDVLIVCPGFTATGLSTAALDGDGSVTRHPQSTVGKLATPDAVADAVFDAAQRSRRMLVLSAVGKTTMLLNRLFPALYEKIMTRSLRRELERS
jgi:NAD(P)-dependent dehydrogenase (short-subunit alcohol dehydrogenase family)